MSLAKIAISPKELELVKNADWILTKNAVLDKLASLMGQIGNAYREDIQHFVDLAQRTDILVSPKVSRGEQYLGLPYIMLDYPRHFTTENIFAIRSLFWWGNHCSIHLVLKGQALKDFGPSIDRFLDLQGRRHPGLARWFIGVNPDPWHHHFEPDNYQPLNEWPGNSVTELPLLKLGAKMELTDWEDWVGFFLKSYKDLLSMCTEY